MLIKVREITKKILEPLTQRSQVGKSEQNLKVDAETKEDTTYTHTNYEKTKTKINKLNSVYILQNREKGPIGKQVALLFDSLCYIKHCFVAMANYINSHKPASC